MLKASLKLNTALSKCEVEFAANYTQVTRDYLN